MAAEPDGLEVDGGAEVKQTQQNQNKTDIVDMKSNAVGAAEISTENDTVNKNENNDESNNIEKENDNNKLNAADENPTISIKNNNEDNLDDKSEKLNDDGDDEDNKNDTLTDISKETLDLSLSIEQNDEVLPTDRENENENANEERFRVDRKQLENLLKGKNAIYIYFLVHDS